MINHQVYLFIDGFASIIDGLIRILTLGFVVTSFSFSWCLYYTSKSLEQKIKLKQAKERK